MSKRSGSQWRMRVIATRSAPPPFRDGKIRRTSVRDRLNMEPLNLWHGKDCGTISPCVLSRDPGVSGIMQFQLLVGADAFWSALEKDVAAARRRVLVQAMTFEADQAGSTAAAAIMASGAADRRV